MKYLQQHKSNTKTMLQQYKNNINLGEKHNHEK